MKKCVMLLGFIAQLFSGKAQKDKYSKYPVYQGKDLGVTYTRVQSTFRVWSPTATQVKLFLYKTTIHPLQEHWMKKDIDGTWLIILKEDLNGFEYTFNAMVENKWMREAVDPYARAVNVNGKRGMIVDLKETSPAGWEKDKSPAFDPLSAKSGVGGEAPDAIIYELHIRDASISSTSGIRHKGKFLGLTETGTKNPTGLSTGLDHIKELGITHVHLLPCFDFNSVDETKPDATYNWGYDPLNYNVPEGSYATDPYDGVTRIKEFKQLVKTFHENGLRVVMDVVYNHTALTETSNFNQLVPGYYYRQTADGKFSNATACGNETASERPMFRKFMLESMSYWVKEYHVDGFRVDLMGVHDIATMNLISKELHKIKPDIIIYGEGWTAGSSPLPDSLRAIKKYVSKLDRIAVFSDDLRDGIKGSVFEKEDKGFVSAKLGMEESIKFGIVASCNHPQVDYRNVNYSKAPYAVAPYQTISYCECHDNHVLWDKLALSAKDASEEERIQMYKLALSIVLTSQGISFLHAGTEFLRSKKGVENSYDSPDSINAIDWSLKTKNKEIFEYVKALINLRKEHPAFRMTSAKQISSGIRFLNTKQEGVIAYSLNGLLTKDRWKKILIFFNGASATPLITFPKGPWKSFFINPDLLLSGNTGSIRLAPFSCTILYQ